MLIRSTAPAAKPGSHHAKFLPLIQETSRKAGLGKMLEKYRQCTEGVKIPTIADVRGEWRCSLEDAKKSGLFDQITMGHIRKVIDKQFTDHPTVGGTDGFTYQVDLAGKPPGVYALRIEGVQITEKLWMGLIYSHGARSFESAKKLIMDIFSDETPTFSLDPGLLLKEECIFFENLKVLLPTEKQGMWLELAAELEQVLHERGYRSSANISTWQEHELNGSTTNSGYSSQPYKPLGVIHSEMRPLPKGLAPLAVEEARWARELSVAAGVHSNYYGLPKGKTQLQVFLEPLDSSGNTIRDPRPIYVGNLGALLALHSLEDAIEKSLIPNVVKSEDFPNRRD
ncbi:MAG: hypothetical protein PHV13_01885 [Candidatus ainarchaeum sp.]|nr:hypothetical protein [Candidatus ainarchaeum sp.]